MKLTKTRLRQIIKEEMQYILQEQEDLSRSPERTDRPRRLTPGGMKPRCDMEQSLDDKKQIEQRWSITNDLTLTQEEETRCIKRCGPCIAMHRDGKPILVVYNPGFGGKSDRADNAHYEIARKEAFARQLRRLRSATDGNRFTGTGPNPPMDK